MLVNICVMEKEHIVKPKERDVSLSELRLDSFLLLRVPSQLIQLLHYFIVTDTKAGTFRYIKSQDIDRNLIFPLEDLKSHCEGIAQRLTW